MANGIESLSPEPRKSLLSHFFVSFIFSGFQGLWDHFRAHKSKNGPNYRSGGELISKQGSTPTPWARGLRDQIQKWALQTQKTLYF